MEIEICLEVHLGIDRSLIRSSSIWGIPISEVLNALATVPG